MAIERLDHVNVRTAHLEAMRRFYGAALGLVEQERPAAKPTFWFTAGAHPVLHLIGADRTDRSDRPQIEHFAFAARGLKKCMERLDGLGIAYHLRPLTGDGLVQLNLRDPDDNRVHLDFPIEEFEIGMTPARSSSR